MPTLHAPLAVVAVDGAEPLPDRAVAVEGDRIAAVGPFGDLAAAHPAARTRRWRGVLAPGRCETGAAALLEAAYHPDPREVGLPGIPGTEPLTGADLEVLAMDDARWGASARRGLQRLLREGVTAVVGPFERPAVRAAVQRSGLVVLTAPRPGALAPGGRADFAVHNGEGLCLATVLGGRLVHRRA